MNEPNFQKEFAEQNRRDYISAASLGTALCIPLNLLCAFMDHWMYPDRAVLFLKARLISVAVTALGWLWFRTKIGQSHPRFGVMWFLSPQVMILWMIYMADDKFGIYYAGLNIVMLGIGVLTPWAYVQNLVFCVFTLAVYLVISFEAKNPQPFPYMVNNMTFLFLTAALVVAACVASSRRRLREFTLRYELDKSRKALEVSLQQLKENEMQLVQSEKLASLGRMSAGIIHEINNPLNFATTGLFTLRKKGRYLAPEQQADYTEVLTDVEDGLKRVQAIVSDLRMFTHPNTEQLDPVPVAEAVTPALRFLSNEWRDRVQIEQKFAEHQTILANKNRLIQAIVNLLQNSLDALKIKSFAPGEKPTIWIEGRVENGQSILSIRDNGTGIDPKYLDKIFDPFFTTKDVGEGMGLGLSICYSIMQEYGGKISVKTELGKSCEFTLEFPDKTNQAVN
jgi:two-component system sensor histidine kinase PhcS